MISTGLRGPASELSAPMVFLAPEHHAFLVLGDGHAPVITWSTSYQFACEQADIHGGVVVAVPIVRDSSWRVAHRDDPTQVPVPAAAMPPADVVVAPEPADVEPPTPEEPPTGGVWAGGPLGRAARGRGQGSPDGWSSARPDVVGQTTDVEPAPERAVGTATVPTLVQRAKPFGDPPAPELPADPEGALMAALDGHSFEVQHEAFHAFHAAAQADVGTLERVLAGLR